MYLRTLRFFTTCLLICFTSLICILSCAEDEVHTLSATPKQLSFAADTQLKSSIIVFCDGNWQIKDAPEWIELSPRKGKDQTEVAVICSENTSDDDRQGEISIVAGDKSCIVTVEQLSCIFDVSASDLTFDPEPGCTRTLKIECDKVWSIAEIPQWLKVSKKEGQGSGEIVIETIGGNYGEESYVGNIQIVCGNKTKNVSVVQRNRNLICDIFDTFSQSTQILAACRLGQDVASYKYVCLHEKDFENMTIEQVRQYTILRGNNGNHSEKEISITFWNLQQYSDYVLCVLPIGKDGDYGSIASVKIRTNLSDLKPTYKYKQDWKNGEQILEWVSSGNYYAEWLNVGDPDVFYAWCMNKSLKNNEGTVYPIKNNMFTTAYPAGTKRVVTICYSSSASPSVEFDIASVVINGMSSKSAEQPNINSNSLQNSVVLPIPDSFDGLMCIRK